MKDARRTSRKEILVVEPNALDWARTTWGEEARVLVSPIHSGQSFCLMDYKAPAHFGPPRHVHFRDDEILRIVDGEVVIWSPNCCAEATTGGVVILPKGVPHTWRSRDRPVRMEVITAPGDLEPFFKRLEEKHVVHDQKDLLDKMSRWIAVENIGPALSEHDAEVIHNGGQPT